MDDSIHVALTATKFILATDGAPEKIQGLNAPVCTAEMKTFIDKASEDRMAELCHSMAKEVYIDIDKRFVYIGENHLLPECSLVEYTEHDPHKYALEFFKRWKKLQMLMFEFTLQDLKGKPIFALKGIWDINKWHSLNINKGNPALNVLKRPLSSWGTFSTHEFEKRRI